MTRPILSARILGLVLATSPLASALAADIDVAKESKGAGPYRQLVADERPYQPVLAPASGEGQARIKQFQVAPGLKVDLWAAEPMLANPVAFSVDEKGRVFTSETYRYRTSVLDIRHYMFMLEDDLACRTVEDRLAMIRKWFGPEGEKALGRETEMIRLIEDVDGDGKADRSSIFADGFTSPLSGIGSGVLAWHGDVWFTEIPSLWRISAGVEAPKMRDSVGSRPHPTPGYRAEELLRGFGVRFSFTGHDLHGLKIGPDGRLYFSVGDRGAHVTGHEKQVIDIPDEGGVFRCELDGSNLELVHRGLRNPQELAFDDRGDLFTGDNDSDQGDRERWVRVVDGADSGWRVGHQHAPLGNAGMWNLERLWVPQFPGQAAYLLPPVANIGDGPSGIVHDYGTSLPGPLKGRFLVTYFKGTSAKSGIHSLAVEQRGAGHVVTAHEPFVWNSLVPDVDLGPDGAVWFADWHEGWPKSNKGRIYRAVFPDLVARPEAVEAARILRDGVSRSTDDQLIGWLGHADQRVRMEAHLELGRRLAWRKPGVDDLERRLARLAQSGGGELARIHAVWALGVAGRSTSWRTPLLALMRPEHGEVAVQAVRAVGWWIEYHQARANMVRGRGEVLDIPKYNRFLQEALGGLMRDGSPRQRAAATEVLSKAGWQDFAPVLRRVLRANPVDSDPVWRTVAAAALARHPSAREAGSWKGDTNAAVRTVALLSLRRRGDAAVSGFLSDPDPLLVLEAARAINDAPVAGALPALAAMADAEKLNPAVNALSAMDFPAADPAGAIRDVRADQPLPWGNAAPDPVTPFLLRVVNANARVGTPESARRLAAMASREDLPEAIRNEALLGLSQWTKPAQRDRVVGVFRPLKERDPLPAREALGAVIEPLLTNAPVAVRIGAAEAAAGLGLTNAGPLLTALLKDSAAPAPARAAALRSLAQIDLKAAGLKDLVALASRDTAEAVRLEASRITVLIDPADAVSQLAAKVKSGSLAEQQAAFENLGKLGSPAADAVISDWLDKLMAREVSNEVMLDLVEAARRRNSPAIKERLARYEEWKLPKDELTPYREALAGGNAARGKRIFYENTAVACTRCHQIGADGGGNAGPKLDGIAGRVTREHLLESVVFPNKAIAEGFATVLVKLKNGQEAAGVVKKDDAAELVLLSPEDGFVTLKKSDIEKVESGLSGMPEGMGGLLSLGELRDVVEFLGTLK